MIARTTLIRFKLAVEEAFGWFAIAILVAIIAINALGYGAWPP